jgi:4-hydroxy-4-methyl-2-oxoglutarate aldolase
VTDPLHVDRHPTGAETDPLVARLQTLHTALLCDVLDQQGHQPVFLGPAVRPLSRDMRVAGRALTLLAVGTTERMHPPYRELLGAYRQVRPGDVFVVATQGVGDSGLWGELLSVAALARGATGAVIDGLCRDVAEIESLGFPVFARGASPLDSAGRQEVVEVGKPVTVAGGVVHPGDYVLGDRMGVVALPAELAEEAITQAEEKNRGESTVRAELARGDDIGEVFDRHGIL